MRNICFVIILIVLSSLLFSELINVNPNPDGEPWIVGGLRDFTEKDIEMEKNLPRLSIPVGHRNTRLASRIDNSELPYFRPVFNQDGGSCAQASGIAYNFTYEVNIERGLTSDVPENQYPSHFTWNYLNRGVGSGSLYFDGWAILKANGCPTSAEYGGDFATGGQTRWMSGYDEYRSGMNNRVLSVSAIEVGNPEGLETLKQWMTDHLDGSEVGGLANFSAGASDYITDYLPSGTHEENMSVMLKWGPVVNHAMTFVGYDDSVRYDYNNDGLYTNDIDTNNDGIVDMRDWEIGAIIVTNSWGESWGDQGKIYMMYRLLAETVANGGIQNNTVYVIRARESFDPKLVMKVKVKHTSRNKIRILAGASSNPEATEPDYVMTFPLINYQGGDHYMQGAPTELAKTLEIGLDVTPLLSEVNSSEPAKFFFMVEENDLTDYGNGEIVSFSLINCLDGETETESSEVNVNIENNALSMSSLVYTVEFEDVEIVTNTLPEAQSGISYSHNMIAEGGTAPYSWNIYQKYDESPITETLPYVTENELIPFDNDDAYAGLDLDFDFPFYDEVYNHVNVTTDGSIIFDNAFSYIRSEGNLIERKAITPFGSDLMLFDDIDDGIWYEGDENGAVIRWQTSNFDEWWVNMNFAVRLLPSGEINFYYGEVTEGLSWVCGVSKGDGVNYTIGEVSNAYSIPQSYSSQFSTEPFPFGMSITEDGNFGGIPLVENGTWQVTFMATDDTNISTLKTVDFTVSGMSNDENINVNKVSLSQNYPNPFSLNNDLRSSGTEIKYSTTENGVVSLDIYNIKGQKVKNLINDYHQAGNHSVRWNGVDSEGKEVTSGIYFYKIRSGRFTSTKKMILMK